MKNHEFLSNQNETTCQYCQYKFASKYGLTKHIKNNNCRGLRDFQTQNLINKLEKQIMELKETTTKEIEELKETTNKEIDGLKETTNKEIEGLKETTNKEIEGLKETTDGLKKEPRVNNQILQVVCVTNNDNYILFLKVLQKHF